MSCFSKLSFLCHLKSHQYKDVNVRFWLKWPSFLDTSQLCVLQLPISYSGSLIMVTITRHIFVNSDCAKIMFPLTWTEIMVLFMINYCHSWVRTKDFLLRLCECIIFAKSLISSKWNTFQLWNLPRVTCEKKMSFFWYQNLEKLKKKKFEEIKLAHLNFSYLFLNLQVDQDIFRYS